MCGMFGKHYNVMDLKRAVDTLNKNKHNDVNTYIMSKFDDTYIVQDELDEYRFTMFEAIAISNEYNRR